MFNVEDYLKSQGIKTDEGRKALCRLLKINPGKDFLEELRFRFFSDGWELMETPKIRGFLGPLLSQGVIRSELNVAWLGRLANIYFEIVESRKPCVLWVKIKDKYETFAIDEKKNTDLRDYLQEILEDAYGSFMNYIEMKEHDFFETVPSPEVKAALTILRAYREEIGEIIFR